MSETQTITIQKIEFTIKAPYAAGPRELSAAEASTLNQVFGENIRNNAAGRIKAAAEKATKEGREFSIDTETIAQEDGTTKTLRQVIQEYADSYEFGVRAVRKSEPVDPVEREAFRIAKQTVTEALAQRGQKAKDLPEGKFDEAVAAYAKSDKVVKEAKRRVAEKEKIGGDLLTELGIPLETAPTEG